MSPRRLPGARGWFVTFEGPEGAGKTSQAALLHRAARGAGIDCISVREPGGTPLGERIREVLLDAAPAELQIGSRADALLFNAARAQLVADVIEPALASGSLVICSRFADSTLAYQGYGAGLPLDALRGLERFATGGRRPDLTILLDLPVEVGLARKHGSEVTRFEADFDVAFHRRVRDGFLALAVAEPDRFVVLDATADPDRVAEAVLAAVLERTGPWPSAVAGDLGAPGAGAASSRGGSEPHGPLERIPR